MSFKQKTVLVALLLVFAAVPALAEQKIGFVNPQRLIDESDIGKTAQKDLAKLGAEKDRLIRDSARQINELKQKLSDSMLSSEQRRELEGTLQAMYEQHDRLIQKSNEDIQYEEAKLIQFIMKRADKSLQDVAQAGGYTMVITDPDIIGYIHPSMDLTDEVIADLNKRY